MSLRLLLDTHVLIWAVATPERMDNGLWEAMAAAENQVIVSSASIWEIAIKRAAGRLVFPLEQFDEIARRIGCDILPILPVPRLPRGRCRCIIAIRLTAC